MPLLKLKSELNSLANPQKAKILQRFFKTAKGEYAEGDIFLGITVPKQREVVKKYLDLELSDIAKLLKSKIHEHRLVALLILVEQFNSKNEPPSLTPPTRAGEPADSSPSMGEVRACPTLDAGWGLQFKIYNFYLSHTKHINNWDLVDLSASNIVGAYLYPLSLEGRGHGVRVVNETLTQLALSQNLWERRIAMVSTFYFIQKQKPEPALKIAEMLLNDKHDLIHKASGWMLREVGKRCGEKYLTNFLDKHIQNMPRTMLRYSIERLPKKLKTYYLKK